ncbi:Crp/Fnr family transcriptional regulator [Rubrivivax sp. RP6-9]|uniref:Crp/Fnr family transcriptional regulator n=1 Tax=Rubrivivax sp. RP6-9 TaxID=3415750 RepID=UPI003CC6BC25
MDITHLVRAIEGLKAEDAFGVSLSLPQWQRIAPYLQRRELATGDLLIRRGDRERVAYLLESGHLQVFVTGGPPGSHRISTLRAGAIVGEPGWFVDAPRMASVEAMTPAVVWALTGDRIDALAADEPRLVLTLLHAAGAVMAVRMRANLERGIPTT